MHVWWRELLSFIAPERCHACLGGLPSGMEDCLFCNDCAAEMVKGAGITCYRCGAEAGPHITTDAGCPVCLNDRFAFAHVLRLGRYEGLLREIVLKCKQGHGEILAEAMGRHFGTILKNSAGLQLPAAVVPAPSHWARMLLRGHNPAHGLALGLSQSLGVPCCPGWLKRTRYTPKQSSLTPTQRRLNLQGAITHRVPAWARGAIVWIVDDVLTTGTTASTSSKALLDGGVGSVVAVVVARGG